MYLRGEEGQKVPTKDLLFSHGKVVQRDDPSDLRFDQNLIRDHLFYCLENNQFTMFPCCMYPSNVCMSNERVLEVELYCECRMPELSESYFGFPTGDMIECTYCKQWYHD